MLHMLAETAVGSAGRDHLCYQNSRAANTTTIASEKGTETGKTRVGGRV